MKQSFKNNQSGFSLLEILIAVAILATSLVSLMSAQGASFLSSERGEALTEATFLARDKMAEIQIELVADLEKNKFPDEGVEKEGAFDEPFEDYRWEYAIKKVEIPMVEGSAGEEGKNAMVGNYMKNITDQISKSVREIKLTIYWGSKDAKKEDQQQMSVTTHIVKL